MEGKSNEEKRLERIKRLAEKIKKGDFEFKMDDDECQLPLPQGRGL